MIWTALILGFAGSLHCVGMCSPLVIAVTNMSSKVLLNRLVYNLGRILTYGMLGAIVASIGFAFPLSQYQILLSLILGLILIAVGFLSVTNFKLSATSTLLVKFNILLKNLFGRFVQRKTFFSAFLLGMLNGFLPCGLTFLALTYSVILPTPFEGFAFMTMFGLGTLPALFGFASAFKWAVQRFHINAQRITTSLFVISGVLLIVRVFFIHIPHTQSVLDIMLCGK